MKVLLINDYFLGGGAEAVFRNTGELLKVNGAEVDYFVGSEKMEKPTSVLNYLNNSSLRLALEKKLNSFQPSVIHIHSFYHYLSGAIFKAIKKYRKYNKVKVVFTAHDYYLICPSSGMTWYKNEQVKSIEITQNKFSNLLFKRIDFRGWKHSVLKKAQWFLNIKIRKIVNEIDHVISPSYFLKEAFEATGFGKKISVLRNPLPNLGFRDSSLEVKVKTSAQIRIIFTGRLSQEKGLLPFLEAFKEINSSDVSLAIFGEGPEKEKIEAFIKKEKLKKVQMNGYLAPQELQKYIDKANVHLLPSIWYENAPLSIIEGAHAGNIILASDIGGVAEMSHQTSSCVLIKNWKKELKQSLELIRTMSKNKLLDEKAYSNEIYLDNIIKIYNTK